MKTLTIKWFTNEDGPKVFYSDSSRVLIYEFEVRKFNEISKLLKNDFNFQGVYILYGKDENGNNLAYVGETESIQRRLDYHLNDEKKNFAERMAIITSKDIIYPYSKTELHYIERKVIEKMEESEYEVKNGNSGQGKDPSVIEMIGLDEELKLIYTGMSMIGMNIEKEIVLEAGSELSNNVSSKRKDLEVYGKIANSTKNIKGIFHNDDTLTIFKGQVIEQKSKKNENSQRNLTSVLNKHKKNKEYFKVSGNLKGYKVEYLKDFKYKAPSTSAVLLLGGNANGWAVWKLKSSKKPISTITEE